MEKTLVYIIDSDMNMHKSMFEPLSEKYESVIF